MNKFSNLLPHKNGSLPPIGITKQSNHSQAVVEYKNAQEEIDTRLATRKSETEDAQKVHYSRIEATDKEYQDAHSDLMQRETDAKRDVEAGHHSAKSHLAEIDVDIDYTPGTTTAADILKVSPMEETEAAQKHGFTMGRSKNDKSVVFVKLILAFLGMIMNMMSIGFITKLIDANDIFKDPPQLLIPLAVGGGISLGLFAAMTTLWRPIGSKVAIKRPQREIVRALLFIVPITLMFLVGMSLLDAKGLVLFNAARATFDPAYNITMETAFLIGLVTSGGYLTALGSIACKDGYDTEVQSIIADDIRADETAKRDKRKQSIPVRSAIKALSEVKVAETRLRQIQKDIAQLDQAYLLARTRMLAAVPRTPTTPTPDEQQRLDERRDRVRSKIIDLDSYTQSRDITAHNSPLEDQK